MTTPFSDVPPVLAGLDPRVAQPWVTSPNRPWLGKPANMVELPAPAWDGYTADLATGEVEQGLASGVSGTSRLISATRRWVIPFQLLTGRDWQIVNGFYRRIICGNGPWVFVPPEDVNRLTLAQSLCGALNGVLEGWAASAGTLTYSSATVANIAPSGVLQWVTGASGRFVAPVASGGTAGHPDTSRAAPNVPGLASSFSFWAKLSTGTGSVKARLSGRSSAGVVGTEVTSSAVTLSTSAWTLVSVSAATGGVTGDYLIPEIVSNSSSTVLVSNPQHEYAAVASDWGVGAGVPRVLWVGGLPRPMTPHRTSDVVMTLAEAVSGAC